MSIEKGPFSRDDPEGLRIPTQDEAQTGLTWSYTTGAPGPDSTRANSTSPPRPRGTPLTPERRAAAEAWLAGITEGPGSPNPFPGAICYQPPRPKEPRDGGIV